MITLILFGVSGYLSSLLLYRPSINVWKLLLILSMVVAFFSIRYLNPNSELKERFSLKNFIQGLIPFLVLIPGIVLLFTSVRIQLSSHGPFHMGYIFQVIHGLSPPENAVLPGYPANVYWLYHALIAVLSDIFNASPIKISISLNIFALTACLSLR